MSGIASKAMAAVSLIAISPVAFGEWEYSEVIDPFEDTDRSYVTASADMYETEEQLVLAVKCAYDGLNLWLFHSYLGGDSDNEVRVQMRVDKDEPYGAYWSMDPSNETSYMPMADVPGMIAQMQAGNKLIFRVTDPLDNESLTQTVSLSGFGSVVEKLACYP